MPAAAAADFVHRVAALAIRCTNSARGGITDDFEGTPDSWLDTFEAARRGVRRQLSGTMTARPCRVPARIAS
jgi:hypothetical protein